MRCDRKTTQTNQSLFHLWAQGSGLTAHGKEASERNVIGLWRGRFWERSLTLQIGRDTGSGIGRGDLSEEDVDMALCMHNSVPVVDVCAAGS